MGVFVRKDETKAADDHFEFVCYRLLGQCFLGMGVVVHLLHHISKNRASTRK